jgi:uncharacterized repeat protein (TIGR01451 family)/fimbrial isopeptide formation D2 family protein
MRHSSLTRAGCAGPARGRPHRGVAGVLALFVLALTFAVTGPARPALAAGTPDISLAVTVPDEVLYGETTPVELTASNDTGTWGYNLSYRAVLPPGISYVPGSAGAIGDPVVLANQPTAGSTTLLWVNAADLAPANTFTLGFEVTHLTSTNPAAPCAGPTACVGESHTIAVGAYVNSDPRFVPDFDDVTGAPITGPASHTGWAEGSDSFLLVPFELEKDEPNAEGEILRGIHDHDTTYTLTVTNNGVNPTNGFTVDDWIPAGMEFLGCGGVDNTTDAPTNAGSPLEYPGAAPLTATPAPADCVAPTLVETVEIDPDGAGDLPLGVYTHVRWTGLGNLGPDGVLVLRYAAGIPIRENTLTWSDGQPATTGPQTANLDNNSGPETTDEQGLTNHAAAAGTYQGAVVGGGAAYTDTDDLTRTAEDLSVHKTVGDETIEESEVVVWELLVETSEYRRLEDIVVLDTLPNGLCPLAPGTDFDTTEPVGRNECDADALAGSPAPSIPYSTDLPPTENPDGTWTVTFDDSSGPQLDQMAASGAFTITMPTQTRSHYQSSGQDTTPVVGRDAWSNEVDISGGAFTICANGDVDCTLGEPPIDADRPNDEVIGDESGAEQEAEYSSIAKAVGEPDADGDCDADVAWLDGDDPSPEFALGDTVCYRLSVGFSPQLHTRNAEIADFLPPNTTYVPGSALTLPGNTVDIVSGDPTHDDGLVLWRLGVDAAGGACDPGSEDCYVQPGEAFDVALAVVADDDPSTGNAFDLVENLMKFSAANTGGTVVPLRDLVDFEVAAPILSLDKVEDAAAPVRQGDDVHFTVTVTNDGNEPALDVEVWDVLPPEVGCADVSAITDGGTCTVLVGRDRIGWTLPGPIAGAGGSDSVTYTVTMPDGSTATPEVAAGDTLTNIAGVRQYETETNTGDRITYIPDENIDPDQDDPNVDPVDDTASVDIVDATVVKTATTLTTQGGNAAAQATVGETIRYTVTFTVPEGTSIYGGALTDAVNSRTTYVNGTAVVTLPDGTVFDDDGSGDPLPSGYSWTDVALSLPAEHHNPDGSGDDVFTLVFDATVDQEAANTRTSGNIPNRATLTGEDASGSAVPPVTSNTTGIQVVEPVVTVSKANSGGPIAGGDTVHYTVTVTNSSATRVSTANDLVVTDTLPAGLTTTAPTGISGGGTYAAGPPQTITWEVASLAPGASATLDYDVLIDDAVVAGQTYTNDVDVDSTSMPEADPQGPERTYATDDQSDLGVVDPPFTKSVAPPTRTIGEVATYTIDLTIPANVELFDGTVVDTLDDGLAFLDHGTCADGGSGLCTGTTELGPDADTPSAGETRAGWFLGDIATSATARQMTFTYTAMVGDQYEGGADVAAGDQLRNAASLRWNAEDEITTTPTTTPDPGGFDHGNPDPPAVAIVDVVEPDLAIDKDVAGQTGDSDARDADVDEVLAYSIAVTNSAGPDVSAAHDIVVVDEVPAGLVVDTSSISADGTWNAGARTITWEIPGPLAPGASVPALTYSAAIGDSAAFGAASTFVNTAEITTWYGVAEATRDANPDRTYREDGGVDDVVTVTPRFPVLEVAKTSTGTAVVGVPLNWTIDLDNTSTVADAQDVDLVDTLPAGWTYQAGSAQLAVGAGAPGPLADPAIAGQELTWTDIADLPAGTGLVLTFAATPTIAAGANDDHVNTVIATGDDTDGNPANDDGPYTDTDDDEVVLTGASLGDRVWEDEDGDGDQDAGETGIEGATVTLVWAGPDGTFGTPDDATIGTQATGPDGAYLFEELPPGQYRATITAVPGGLVPTDDLDGVATPSVATADLDPGEDRTDVDFGYRQESDLTLTKTVDDDTLDANDTATFRILVGNDGPNPAEGPIVVTDTLPDGLVPDTAGGTGWSCTTAAQVVTCSTTGPLANGDTLPEIVVTATVSATADLTLTNTATVDSETHDPDPDDNTDEAEVTARRVADLVIDKSHAASAFVVGEEGTYTIGIANQGPSPSEGTEAEPVTVTDTLPDGLTPTTVTAPGWDCTTVGQLVTCEYIGVVANGSSFPAISITVEVGTAAEGGVTNTATVVPGTTHDPEDPDNTDEDPTEVTPSADLSLVKTSGGSFVVGEQGSFTFTVHNDGPSVAASPITISDTLATGLTYVSSSSTDGWTCAAVGQDVTCTLAEAFGSGRTSAAAVTVAVDATVDPDVVNSATVTSPTLDPDPENNTSGTDDPSTPTIDLVIDKHHTGDLLVGSTGTYLVDVANNGPSVSEGTVTVTDTLPTGLTPTAASGTGWTCEVTAQDVTCTTASDTAVGVGGSLPVISVDVEVLPAAYPTVTNTAVVAPPQGAHEVVTENNTDDDPTTVLPVADLELTKTHDGTFAVGQPGTYTLTATNHGPTPTPGPLVVEDTLPLGLTFTSAAGEGWACAAVEQDVTCTYTGGDLAVDATTSVTLTVDVGTAAEGQVTNTATVSGPADDPDEVNDTDEDPTTVDPVADLSITKVHDGDLLIGAPAQWRIDVANAGPSTSRGPITVSDTIPDAIDLVDAAGEGWDCEVAGQDVTCTRTDDLLVGPAPTITVDVIARPGSEGEVTNTAVVSGTTIDPVEENDTADDTATVVPSFDLTVTKELVDDQLVADQDATWRIVVANAGPSAAADVTVVDTLPAGLRYASTTDDGWTCTPAGQTVTCTLDGSLAAGDESTLDLVTTVEASAGASITNRAEVLATGSDLNDNDNAAATNPAVVDAAPTPPGPNGPRTGGSGPNGGLLARTGSDVRLLVLLGLLLAGGGATLLLLSRLGSRRTG